MKSQMLKPVLFLMSLLVFTACQKDKETENALPIEEDEALEVVEMALVGDDGGMIAQVEEVAVLSATHATDCGLSFDSTITRTNLPNAVRTFNYVFNWNWNLVCNNFVPEEFSFNYNMTGVYDTPRMSSDDNAEYNFVLTNLLPSQSHYTYNGSYVRNGTQVSKVRQQRSFSSVTTFNTSNLMFNKDTKMVDSGTTTFSFVGTVEDGATYTFEGTITYTGNKTATIEVNGNTYEISW